jgi:sigma-E factor negative regulatory protein RseB
MQMRAISFALALLCVTLPALPAASADEARAWIKRMNEAVVSRNYDGVLEHEWRGGREMLRVIHRMRDGHLSERVIVLGSSYENARNGTRFTEYDHAKRIAKVQTLTRSYGYISAFNGISAESDKYYDIRNDGPRRLPNYARQTQLIVVQPKDAYRYGYRFWLDQESAMPILTQLVNVRGEVIDKLFFQSLSLPESIDDELLKVNNKGYDFRKPVEPLTEVRQAFVPRATLLPPGFRKLNVGSRDDKTSSAGPETRFIISDGVTWVSVFVSVKGPEAVGATQVSPWTLSYVYPTDGHFITAIGEAPPAAVKAVAEAFRPE